MLQLSFWFPLLFPDQSNRNSAHFVISLMIFCSLKLFTRGDRNMQAQVTREFKNMSNFMNYHITTEEASHMLKISKALKIHPERVTKITLLVKCSLFIFCKFQKLLISWVIKFKKQKNTVFINNWCSSRCLCHLLLG